MDRYLGRVVMISGAAQGLGQAMAERFAREGAILALGDVNHSVKDVATTLSGPNAGSALPAVLDVADAGQVDGWVAETLAAFGRVDVMVNNAGIVRDNRIERMTDEQWQEVVDVCLRGTFHCCRAAVAPMKRQHYGRILSVSSMSWRGNFGQANYAAAKAGVVGMARTIALETAGFGITSNVLAPGLIDTQMLASMNTGARDKLISRVPIQRIGRPDEIAEAASFLCSDLAGYITGVILDVDGGISIGSSLR